MKILVRRSRDSTVLKAGIGRIIMFSCFSISFEPEGWEFSVDGSYPINDSFSLFGKLGVLSWELESDIEGLVSLDKESGTDVFFGLGGDYNLSENLSIRTEWERYDIENTDFDLWSLGIIFRL